MRLFTAPFVLEGGAILVDGEGTLITTEQCLLNPNRNPGLTREAIEQGLRDYLGVTTIVWLPVGHVLDTGPEGTDGHVDGVAQVLAPGRVLIEAPSDPTADAYAGGQANLAALRGARDARGRPLEISDPRPGSGPGRVLREPLRRERCGDRPGHRRRPRWAGARFPLDVLSGTRDRRRPGATLAFGGGGPHCITQQIPAGGIAAS